MQPFRVAATSTGGGLRLSLFAAEDLISPDRATAKLSASTLVQTASSRPTRSNHFSAESCESEPQVRRVRLAQLRFVGPPVCEDRRCDTLLLASILKQAIRAKRCASSASSSRVRGGDYASLPNSSSLRTRSSCSSADVYPSGHRIEAPKFASIFLKRTNASQYGLSGKYLLMFMTRGQ